MYDHLFIYLHVFACRTMCEKILVNTECCSFRIDIIVDDDNEKPIVLLTYSYAYNE